MSSVACGDSSDRALLISGNFYPPALRPHTGAVLCCCTETQICVCVWVCVCVRSYFDASGENTSHTPAQHHLKPYEYRTASHCDPSALLHSVKSFIPFEHLPFLFILFSPQNQISELNFVNQREIQGMFKSSGVLSGFLLSALFFTCYSHKKG